MSSITHELIRASAGTGKTYQLTNRYLRILFITQEPEKVIALTFTRKAAGEFFDKIFRRLADAAEDEIKAAKLGEDLGLNIGMAECRANLRLLLERLHRLHLSTYDSFFTRVVQTFPFELGLAGAPSLLDEEQHLRAIERSQQALSRRTQSEKQFLTDFWHACKRATMGAETKTVTEIVTGFIQENHALFFDASHSKHWGSEATIWGGKHAWTLTDIDLPAEAEKLHQALDWTVIAPVQAGYWRELIQELNTWRAPLELPKRIEYFVPRFLEQYEILESGNAVLKLNRKDHTLSITQGIIVKRIARFVGGSVLKPRLEATQGIYDLVRLFEEIYSQEVRLMGQLTLEDVTRFLSGGLSHGPGLMNEKLRQQLGYRLDGALDHWLLDEFQDTSRTQWKAIADLIDEVIQDSEGRRSFFAVGDNKQSLYGWRGSDDRLFDRVHGLYGSQLALRSLNESYRSAPAVLAMANGVFGQSQTIAEILTPGLAKRWEAIWESHQSAASLVEQRGYSCLLHAPFDDPKTFQTILNLLTALQPLEKGLSVAILTQKNDTAHEIVEYLRAHNGPACSLAANALPGRDNVVAAGLRSFLTLTAHPADTVAWQHLRMTPVGSAIATQFGDPKKLSHSLLKIWSDRGLPGLVAEWSRLCSPFLDTGDFFNRGRLALCRSAAQTAEERGERDLDLFIRQLESLTLREHDNPGQVAVMTIHKAKGLDWDIVILTDLAGNTLLERRGGLEVHRDEKGEIEWVLDMPPSDLAKHDQALAKRIDASKEDAAFEKLCALYVALTRAKSGLYVITHPSKKTSNNFHRLLDETLGAMPHPVKIGRQNFVCAWESGDADWLEGLRSLPRPQTGPSPFASLPMRDRSHELRPIPLQPSAEKSWRLSGQSILARDRKQRELGTNLHHAFSQMEWLDLDAVKQAERIDETTTGLDPVAREWMRRVFAEPKTRAIFTRPSDLADLWRETPFEILIDNRWISGRFDRVLVMRNREGEPTSATIYDLKIHGVSLDDDALRRQHGTQLATYRTVATRLLGLPEDSVQTVIVVVETQSENPPRLVYC